MTDYFTTTPTPVAPGGTVKVCFDFTAAGVTTPVAVTIDYSPSSVADDNFTLTPQRPCADRTVPSGATTAIAIDDSGVSQDHPIAIS